MRVGRAVNTGVGRAVGARMEAEMTSNGMQKYTAVVVRVTSGSCSVPCVRAVACGYV